MTEIQELSEAMKEANQKADRRHRLAGGIATPTEDDVLGVVRCVGCRKLMTEWEVRRWGSCTFCEGHRFHGVSRPTLWEDVRLTFWEFFGNWRVWGWYPEDLEKMPWGPKLMRRLFPLKEQVRTDSR